MAVMDTLVRWVTGRETQRAFPQLAFQDWVNYFNFNGALYPLQQTLTGDTEHIAADFTGFVQGAYKSNGIVYACIQARLMLLSQARFQFQQLRQGRPGDLFGNADLGILERPEPGKQTADLLARASVDVDLAGNSFIARRMINGVPQLKRLRPDWVTIVMGSPGDGSAGVQDIDAEVIGYIYYPGGRYSGTDPVGLLAMEVAHFAPIPDPLHRFRGMSWLTPIIRDLQADSAATSHKQLFFENGATPNMVVTITASTPERFKEVVNLIEAGHTGLANAYKTLYLSAGTTAEVVGKDLQQVEFSRTQGAGETRVAAASGIHPVILGISEGLSGSSLNQGNFMAARRLVADKVLRPWWGGFAASMEVIVPPPSASRLWYDDRHIPFLAEDVKDAAEVLQSQASTIKSLSDAGFEPDAVVAAVMAGDLSRLKGAHSGLFSVQLQPPGSLEPDPVPLQLEPPPDLEAGRAFQLELARESRPSVTISDGAVHVPVTVNPPNVTIERGAVQVDAPAKPDAAIRDQLGALIARETTIHVHPAEVHTPISVPPAVVNVQASEVRAPKIDVHVPEQSPPIVNVEAKASAPNIDIHVPEQAPANITVEAKASPPVITVEAKASPPNIDVHVVSQPKRRKTVTQRDADGRIQEVIEE